jgi:hypothetical protein
MDVSKYSSVSDWRDDLKAQGWNVSIMVGWALTGTMSQLGLTFQEAMDLLVWKKKLIFCGRTVLADLSFQTFWEEVKELERAFKLPAKDPSN